MIFLVTVVRVYRYKIEFYEVTSELLPTHENSITNFLESEISEGKKSHAGENKMTRQLAKTPKWIR